LNDVSTLPVKLKILFAHMLPLSCKRKKVWNLSHYNCGLQIGQIWIQLITVCGKYCKRRWIRYILLIWTNWNSDWERSGPNWITSLLRRPLVSGVVDFSVRRGWRWTFWAPSLTLVNVL